MGRSRRTDGLTEREGEVLSLIRLGLTNEQIAERLGVTLAGAKYHVSEILSKLGVSSREEASAWQPAEQHETWWRRALALSLVVKIAGALVVVAALAGVALLGLGAIRGGSGETETDLDYEALATDSALTISGNSVSVARISTGQVVRTVAPGTSNLWATLRPSASQLLVSDTDIDGVGRLSVYDIEHGAEVVRQVPMPGRLLSISGYDPAMALAADGRTLYYESGTWTCPGGGDAAVCEDYAIGIIDLDTGAPTTSQGLPANCGYGRLSPLGAADVLVTCPYTSETYTVHSTGLVEKIVTFLDSYPVVFGGRAGDQPYLLRRDGSLLFSDDSTLNLLAPGQRVELWSSAPLISGALLVAYSGPGEQTYDTTGMPMVQGITIVDPLHTEGARSYTLPPDISHVYPVPDGRLALLNRNAGTIEIVTPLQDGLIKESKFSSDAYWIAY